MNGFLILILLVVIVFLWRFYKNRYKLSNDITLAFTGTMGSGKTLTGVLQAIKHNNKQYYYYLFEKFLNFFRFKKYKKYLEIPLLYSSIPINHKRYIPLNAGHLLLCKRINQNSTIFIDEIGQIANSQDFKELNLKFQFQDFIRFSRHYLGNCRLIFTDQSSDNIVLYLRRRLSYIYHLSNFKKLPFNFYCVDITPLLSVEDVTNVQTLDKVKTKYKYYGFIGFKKKKYDTRCYSNLFNEIPLDSTLKYGLPSSLKCNYFIDLINYKIDYNFKINKN